MLVNELVNMIRVVCRPACARYHVQPDGYLSSDCLVLPYRLVVGVILHSYGRYDSGGSGAPSPTHHTPSFLPRRGVVIGNTPSDHTPP